MCKACAVVTKSGLLNFLQPSGPVQACNGTTTLPSPLPTGGYHRPQWQCGLRRSSAAAHLLRLWVRIPAGAWKCVCCECCLFLDRGLCNELITHPEESYRLWCVVVCDLETSCMRRPWSTGGYRAKNKIIKNGGYRPTTKVQVVIIELAY